MPQRKSLGRNLFKHANVAGITGAARKLLSFTYNRQDASLQAGHFNDFGLFRCCGLPSTMLWNDTVTFGTTISPTV